MRFRLLNACWDNKEKRECVMKDSRPHCYLHRMAMTPLVPLRIAPDAPCVYCKLEYLNASGSTKDRIARHILEKASRKGLIDKDTEIVEASSGSTSISLALCCAQLGLAFHAFIPQSATAEREKMIAAYGARVTRIDGEIEETILEAERYGQKKGVFLTRQFENPDNAEAHQLFTAREILVQIPSVQVDAFTSGVGTGGTFVGLHQGLLMAGCNPLAVAAIPSVVGGGVGCMECSSTRFSTEVPGVMESASRLFSQWRKNPEACQRIVEMPIEDSRCLELTHALWKKGFPVGPSSGLNLAAALDIARELPKGATVVTLFPDRMERYFSHKVFDASFF